MNTKLHAVADAQGRPIRMFVTAGPVSDYTGAAVMLSSLPKAGWMRAALGLPADQPFEMLLAEAMARLAQAEQRRQARQQLAELQEDLRQREADRKQAEETAASWLSDWQDAASDTLLAGQSVDVEGMGRLEARAARDSHGRAVFRDHDGEARYADPSSWSGTGERGIGPST